MREVSSLAAELKDVLCWHQARMLLLAQFMLALLKVRTINLTQVAQGFSGSALPSSNYKRLQRFIKDFKIDSEDCAKAIAKWFCPQGKWILCLDRTNWKFGKVDINFLVLAVAYRGVAIPLYWPLLEKKGNSNTEERIALLNRFVNTFGIEKIDYFTADREFRGGEWFRYLIQHNIPFCIRIPNNTKVCNNHKNIQLPVSRLFNLALQEEMVLRKPRKIWGVEVYLSCIIGSKGHVIIASSEKTKEAIRKYRVRWSIETLFGCLKTRGFNLEDTHITHPVRLQKIFFILALVFCWSLKVGTQEHDIKPIKRKKHGRLSHSIFRVGLNILQKIVLNLGEYTSRNNQFNQVVKVLSCT